MDTKWHVETAENVGLRILELHRTVKNVATVALPDKRVAWRQVPPGEGVYSRLPQEDGIDFKPVGRGSGRKSVSKYPWDIWTDGNWHLAKFDRDYNGDTDSFVRGVRKKASITGMKVSIVRFGGRRGVSQYGREECVGIRFYADGGDKNMIGMLAELRHEEVGEASAE